jgi:formamidopyrimidine-DNA glycosylase
VPELPEVETIVRGLAQTLVGKTITRATVLLPRVVEPDAKRFSRALAGERVTAVGRRGKFVLIVLASGRRISVHLRMTGRLIVGRGAAPETEPYARVILELGDRSRLCFADARTFGRMRLLGPGEEPADGGLGIEPLSEDFTSESFNSMLDGRSTPVKVLLLDQRRVAGIGNIYACEALWRAGIRPSRAAGSLSRPSRSRLHRAIREVLAEAIALRGTSSRDYVDADGVRGGFQNKLSVYGRDGEPCPRCEHLIVRTVIAQRGTWWCRNCQRR